MIVILSAAIETLLLTAIFVRRGRAPSCKSRHRWGRPRTMPFCGSARRRRAILNAVRVWEPCSGRRAPMSDRREKVVLIDAYSLIHRAFYALPPLHTSGGEPTNAVL